jgi:hypothetical protein
LGVALGLKAIRLGIHPHHLHAQASIRPDFLLIMIGSHPKVMHNRSSPYPGPNVRPTAVGENRRLVTTSKCCIAAREWLLLHKG